MQTKNDLIIIKSDARVRIISETSAGYDLLIIGTPSIDSRLDIMFGSNKDKFADSAACSVLRLSLN